MSGSFLETAYKAYDFDGRNKDYSENKYPVADPVVGERSGSGILCCSDPRCAPEAFFKLTEQEAFVIRNEGGRAGDPGVIRTVLLIDALITGAGAYVQELKVIHHTGKPAAHKQSSSFDQATNLDCAVLQHTEQEILDIIKENDPNAPGGPWKPGAFAYAEAVALIPFPKGGTEKERLEKSVKQDVKFLRAHPLLRPRTAITGWIYDIKTGVVEKLDV
jgi:carbonic anhydrase